MRTINIGVANLVLSNFLKESYFNEKFLSESKHIASEFIDLIKNSQILQLEFKVFDNIENKKINNDVLATRYIDNNIKLFEVYTLDEIEAENKKMGKFVDLNVIKENIDDLEENKVKLYTAIGTLIEESLKPSDETNVDQIHESFSLVLEHIKKEEKIEISESDETINENILEIAVDKFNEKYSTITESDREFIKTLIKATSKEKEKLFEEYKIANISILKEDEQNEKIQKTINKLNEMSYNEKTIDDDIIDLYELNRGLL